MTIENPGGPAEAAVHTNELFPLTYMHVHIRQPLGLSIPHLHNHRHANDLSTVCFTIDKRLPHFQSRRLARLANFEAETSWRE